jgi:phosphatidate cytidylyltransferase
VLLAGGASLALAVVLVATGHALPAHVVAAMGTLGAASLTTGRTAPRVAGGIPYAARSPWGRSILRSDGEQGFLAVLFLFAVVWTTDYVAYFSGARSAAPSSMPQVSPNKTWSGAIGGTLARRRGACPRQDAALPGCSPSPCWRSFCRYARRRRPVRIVPQAPVRRQGFGHLIPGTVG